MDNFYWLDRIQSADLLFVGNQAFHLSQLLQRGYPVVPGFVVPARAHNELMTREGEACACASAEPSAFESSVLSRDSSPGDSLGFWEFMEMLGESEPLLEDFPHSSFYVDVDSPRQLQQVAQQIRHAIVTATLPPAWTTLLIAAAQSLAASVLILHPSLSLRLNNGKDSYYSLETQFSTLNPTHRFPLGILDSHTCHNQPDSFILSLKRVWAELFRARSLFYWQRNGIELQQLNLAVLVQPLGDAIASGTVETDVGEWKIQATWGTGEALTRGEVLPDSYQLQSDTGTVLASFLGSKARAYHPVASKSKSDSTTDNTLQVYAIAQEQQQKFALDEKSLHKLIELSQRLAAEFTQTFSLEWTLCQPPGSTEPQLYITQFVPQPRVHGSQISMSTQPSTPRLTPEIFRGLPAASGQVTAPAQVLIGKDKNLEEIPPGRIWVAKSISPDWLPWLKSAVGIVTEQGGMTCHAAILARELGIPAVVSAADVTQLIQTGEFLLLDGNQGEVHRVGRQGSAVEGKPSIKSSPSPVFQRPYPIATQLLVNLSQPGSLEQIAGLSVDGVGLLRSELMMVDILENQPLNAWLRQDKSSELTTRLAHVIVQFAATFAPRPVFYRSLDWRSHEFQRLASTTSPSEPEVNPIVGRRGTLRYLDDPTCFDLELAALKEVQSYGYTNVHLMLPFVRTVEEFNFCRRRVEQAGLTENPYFQLWIMAEVPSVLFLLPDYVKAGIQGISIGSNDLTQLLLATDRDNEQLSSPLNGNHLAVRRAFKQLIEMARDAGIPCSICGQAPAQYPELIDSLVQWGITSISVDVSDVEPTYQAIARAEHRLLLEAARRRLKD